MNDIDVFRDKLSIFNVPTLKDLEEELVKLPQILIPTIHTFSAGIYVREIHIPAGTIVIGKRHRHSTCNMLMAGELSIYMGPNLPVKHLTAPCIFTSEPGAKKMGYAHTDVIFVNVHPTTSTDLEEIEKEFIITEKEYREQLENKGEEILCLG